ncbi:tRNA (adenine(22)-N(1))-methyltransferase TrmK [Paenibacillus alkaliterrae]|uniref:tRNA (adenine(22)-N(1))-methyltransferase n=1 Tax=Paenibacillus alkaliterrae TaxID=320909 RepID=UPI001F18B885|nr:tRNA (adenine(22)-N(1))-methyltransferase TrmK [Paenibacillus alkaliterrae]MCF2937455.1 tRNA (adenine(22)-N(1))-methyltransferase TrmK [Paenibacillus alkaliterrae]
MLKLSKRLQGIADYVSPGSKIADIGSDHAMLPVYLLQIDKCPAAIAGELNAGPYEAAKKQGADAGLSNRLTVRQGDGLQVLQPGEADTVTIAGMGGSLMSEILEAGHAAGKLEGVKELVLQPNVGEEIVREWLLEHGWYLEAESILEEDGKIYEIMHAVRISEADIRNANLYEGEFLPAVLPNETKIKLLKKMGPHLLRNPKPVLYKKWRHELNKLERICDQLAGSDLAESAHKQALFRAEIKAVEEVLQCLPMAKP